MRLFSSSREALALINAQVMAANVYLSEIFASNNAKQQLFSE